MDGSTEMNLDPTTAALFLAAALGSAAGQDAQEKEPLPTASELLARMDAALGDPAKRRALPAIRMTGKLVYPGMEPASIEEIHLADGRARFTANVPGFDAMTIGIASDFSWSTDPAVGVTIRKGDEQGPVKRMFGFCRVRPWNDLYASAETVGTATVDGKECVSVEMQPRYGEVETWQVEAATALPLRIELSLPDPLGKGAIPMAYELSDFRAVDGLLFPFVRTQVVGSYRIPHEFESIVVEATIHESAVAPPQAALDAAADATRKSHDRGAPTVGGECKVEEFAGWHTASIRAKVKESEISQQLAILLPEVANYIAARRGKMIAPPFTRYHGFADGTIDLEAGIPVAEPIAIEGDTRVRASSLPKGRAATTWHVGPYHELTKTHARLEKWMKEQQLEVAGPQFEIYWTDPGIEPDPAKWRTQIYWPVK
jgi:effector-binding domain-containing protein